MIRDRNRLIAVMANDNFIPWYINNFIPLIMYESGNIHCYDTTNYYEIFDIYDRAMDMKFISESNSEISNIEKAISDGQYVLAFCDQYFVEGSVDYSLNHKYSEILVYGFDSDSRNLNIHTAMLGGKDYNCGLLSYDLFQESIVNSYVMVKELESTSWQFCFGHPLSSFKVKSEGISSINFRKLYFQYCSLLSGKHIEIKVGQTKQEFYTGVNVFNGIEKLCEKILINKDDDTITTAIWTIKLLSQYIESHKYRLSYIEQMYGIKIDNQIKEDCSLVSLRIMMIYNLLQKYLRFGREHDIRRAVLNIPETRLQFEDIIIRIKEELFLIIQKN